MEINALNFIVKHLKNDDISTDDQMAIYLTDETKIVKHKIERIIARHRKTLLRHPLLEEDIAVRLVMESITR
jgi:hypothetical protein